ncbi:class I SAM-dependent methyltransferase [Algoriphagus sp.]|uniref:class I SAM-dependent methyltransferase n=1 Tax=Algoriphagus sp. TaxID=1872435 RepID=UPI002604A843|nr:class I SAM-dependent methyltransferase [Algoriphagus sp.]
MDFSEFYSVDFRQFVQDHLDEDPALLLFKYQEKVSFDLKLAVQQISSRQKARKKLPSWAENPKLLFPTSLSLEQSSSEQTARFKAGGWKGEIMIDLTGGFGVDFFYLSEGFNQGIYCERQTELFQITKHNLKQLESQKNFKGKFEFVEGDGLEFLQKTPLHVDLIYLDPARRGSGNQKLYKLQDCQPDVVGSWSLLKSKGDQILIKSSPMLDISQAWEELPEIQQIIILSVKNEVKELLLSWKKENTSKQIQVVDLGGGFPSFSFDPKEEGNAVSQLSEAENYLIEPLSGILKAGAFTLFAARFGLKKLEKNSHVYTCSALPKNSIPARIFEIIEEIPPNKKVIKALFPAGKVNVICRNYSQGAHELKKKLGLKDGGEEFLIGTKSPSGFKLFRCRRIS